MRPTRSASFCNLVTFSCTDRNYATDASKRLRFGDITKYMCSKHSAKFGVSSLKNEVTGYFFIMGKYLCRTLYLAPQCHNFGSTAGAGSFTAGATVPNMLEEALLYKEYGMGGELSKREGCFFVHFKAKRGVSAVSFIDLRKFMF